MSGLVKRLRRPPYAHLPIRFVQGILIVVILSWMSGCLSEPVDLVKYPGRWTGWMGIGENRTGYNTTIIKDDRYCTIHGEITGNKLGWGDYKLTVDGEGYLLMGGEIIGEVEITLIMNETDTLIADGSWGGRFDQKIPVGWGDWFALPNGKFTVDGQWMAQKENSVDVSLKILGY